MKMTKKKLFTVAVAICLVAILSFSSLAWFTDDDTVTNEFYLADSNMDADQLFSVDVLEGIDTDGDNVADQSAGMGNDRPGWEYENILPGSQLSKRPQAENKGAYDQYIRMHVVVSNVSVWARMLGNYQLTVEDLWLKTLDTANWERLTAPVVDSNEDTVTYTYYYKSVLKTPDTAGSRQLTPKLFSIVEIPSQLTREDMILLPQGAFTIDVVAEAVQTENLGDGVDTPYEAFAVVTPDTTPDLMNP